MRRSSQAITLVEILVILALIAVLIILSRPAITIGPVRGRMTQTLSNARQLQLATEQMVLDNRETGNPIAWTCSNTTPLTYQQWRDTLVPAYLTAADFDKLTTATEQRKFWFDKTVTNAFTVFAVTATDPADTVFLTTKNWHGPNTTNTTGEPYGKGGVIVFRKSGDGMILLPRQATDTNIIGSGGSHNYLPLK